MSDARLQKWEEKVKKSGLRLTQQRRLILSVLKNAGRPLTAVDIFCRLKQRGNHIEKSTVYRNLNEFCNRSLVEKTQLESNKTSFELKKSGQHFHHIMCLQCGDVLSLPCPLKDFNNKLTESTEYEIVSHQLNLYGFCPVCQEKEEEYS